MDAPTRNYNMPDTSNRDAKIEEAMRRGLKGKAFEDFVEGKATKKAPVKPSKKGGVKSRIMEFITRPFRKIEDAMEKRTGSESMRKKHFPMDKKKKMKIKKKVSTISSGIRG